MTQASHGNGAAGASAGNGAAGVSARRSATAAPAGASRIGDLFLARLAELERRVEKELDRPAPASGPVGEFVLDFAREAWRAGAALVEAASTSAGRRAALASWTSGGEVDELGFDRELSATLHEILRPFARRWVGLGETGSHPLPERGGVLVLLNRSAWPLPVEAMILGAFLADGRCAGRRLAVLWDDDLGELPWWSDFLRKVGVVAATMENARALLERGDVVVAFPEGRAARAKTYDRRYRLARFEARGILEGAVEAGATLVPGAVVGPEESYPLLGYVGSLPVTAQFPLFAGLGTLPLPLAWRLRLGPAVPASVAYDEIDRVADSVRTRMQSLLGELLAERRSLVSG